VTADSSRRAKLIVCFATVYLIWGSSYLASSIGVHALPPFLFGGIRFFLAGVLLTLVALALGRRIEIDRNEWKHLVVVGFGTVLVANGCSNWAMQWVASNQTALLNASAALWIALLATRGRRAHPLDRRSIAGLVIGFIGTGLLIWPSGGWRESHLGAQFVILVAVFSWSASTVYLRNAQSKLDVLSFTGLQMLIGGLMLTALGLINGEVQRWHWSNEGFLAMGYLIIMSSCLAYTAFAWLAKNTTPAMAGTYSYVNPAVAAVLGWWLLDEKLGVAQILGMGVMLAGVALVSWPQNEPVNEPTGS
jgi:drug/metabolite transporter (DMT)-like permease